jgi:hypothetical protein
MRLKITLLIFQFLMIPLLWSMLFGSTAIAQEVCFPFPDAQRIYHDLEAGKIFEEELGICNDKVVNLEKEKALMEREKFFDEKLRELAEKERDLYKEAYERERKIADDALKLVEKTEKRSTWTTIGTILLGISAVILAFVH